MPHRRLPNTNASVIRTLTAARDAWKANPTARLIDPTHWAKLDDTVPDSLLNRLLKEADDVTLALAAQAPLTDASAKGIAQLTLYVSHFHQVYDFAVLRNVFTAGSRAFYDREVGSGGLPDLTSAPAVLEAAAKIRTGEAKRQQAEGAKYIPMALPSAAEVAAVETTAATLWRDSRQAIANTGRQQDEFGALYPEAQRLAVSICNAVEYHLGNDEAYATLDDPARRRIARQWGVVYIYDATETPDPGDNNAANTTPKPAGQG